MSVDSENNDDTQAMIKNFPKFIKTKRMPIGGKVEIASLYTDQTIVCDVRKKNSTRIKGRGKLDMMFTDWWNQIPPCVTRK